MSNKGQKAVLKMDILYEDDDCAVINKLPGYMVHPDGRGGGPFVTEWVVKNFPEAAKVGEPIRAQDGTTIDRPGIVHRLDRETSGALIIAKTSEAHARLKKQFQDRTIEKKYVAFVWGRMEEEFGTIDRPIGRSGSDFRKWSAQRGARGDMREAETYWTRLAFKEIGTGPESQAFSLIQAEPKTGRTHQIRVHFAAIQHPVVCDRLYAPKRPLALGFERTALHSQSIEFETKEGKRVIVVAPLPADFVKACKELEIDIKKIKALK